MHIVMKKVLSILLLAVVVIASGCTKNEVVIPNITVNTTIKPSDWKYDNSTKTWYVNIDMPEITSQTNETDGILVSVSFGDGVYELVPDIYNGYAFYVTHQPGTLTLEAQNQFGSTDAPADNLAVKIVIVPSN